MNIKIGDYIKHKLSDDWERVNLVAVSIFTDEQGADGIKREAVKEALPYNEEVLVSVNGNNWFLKKFFGYNKTINRPYLTFSSDGLSIVTWQYAKPLTKVHEIKFTDFDVNTVEVMHDLLVDMHGYSFANRTMSNARELALKLQRIIKEQ